VEEVRRWESIPVQDIVAENAVIYDGYEEDSRRVVENLERFPLIVDEEEVKIYNEDGYRIPRRVGILAEGTARNGMLMNLRDLGQLFDRTLRLGKVTYFRRAGAPCIRKAMMQLSPN